MSITYPIAEQRSSQRTLPLRVLAPIFFYFLTAGIATVMLGPLLPGLIRHWQIQDAQAGVLFTADFLGQLLGAWFATRNLRNSVLFGAAISAAGCVAMVWVSFGWAPIALFCIGLGLGAGLAAGNVIVGIAVSGARVLALLNIAWGLGAISCPILIHFSAAHGVRAFFLLTAALLAAASLFTIALPRTLQQTVAATEPSQLSSTVAAPSRLPRRAVLIFASAMFLYIGVENSLGGWLPSYAIRINPSLQASSIALLFWLAELFGRLLLAAFNTRVSEATLYRVSLACLLFAEILLCIAVHLTRANLFALAILSGLALAPLYPLIVSFMLARTGNHPRLGSLFACASLGGAVMPWLTGVLSTEFHGLRAGLVVPAVGACLLLLLSADLTRKPVPRYTTSQ